MESLVGISSLPPPQLKKNNGSIGSFIFRSGDNGLKSHFVQNCSISTNSRKIRVKTSHNLIVSELSPDARPLKVIISGAPASGKGTQCEEIVKKYGLTHISAGDLLRAEVAAGTENGNRVKSYMDAGALVPDEVVISIVKDRLAQRDAQENGWLLDGYPRSASQAVALEAAGIKPQIFILLEVPEEILVGRVVGRRLDPVTGKIYHLEFSPPENEEIAARLTQRSDDTEEKVKARLETHRSHVDSVLDMYKDIVASVDGARSKSEVFADIDTIMTSLVKGGKEVADEPKSKWRGVPTQLNTTPHSREIRNYFYQDICQATLRATKAGLSRLKVQATFPELNPEMDVYRIGTLMELMRELAFAFARDGKKVRVCVQGSMGSGVFAGMPLALAGTRKILELMDWGEELNHRISLGAVGKDEVKPEDDVFILMAPQNAVGNCIIDFLEPMAEAAGERPFIIVNPRLNDIPSASGVMQIGGRDLRLAFVASFQPCYSFRLLYNKGTQYPILGALRMAYPGKYEVYKRIDYANQEEDYQLMDVFDSNPTSADIADAFAGRKKEDKPTGFWGYVINFILN